MSTRNLIVATILIQIAGCGPSTSSVESTIPKTNQCVRRDVGDLELCNDTTPHGAIVFGTRRWQF